MALASRLDGLEQLLAADMEALPDMPPAAGVADTESDGGVQLTTHEGKGLLSELEMLAITDDDNQAQAREFSRPHDLKASTSDPEPAPPLLSHQGLSTIAAPHPDSESARKNTVSVDKIPERPVARSSQSTLGCGDLASPDQAYSPVLAISKFPYHFVEKRDSQNVASAIFDNNKFWELGWDLYYVWPIDGSKPLILVTQEAVQALLDDINRKFPHIGAKITDRDREQGLLAKFPNHPRLTPRYLGHITSKPDFDKMAAGPPGHKHRAPGEGHAPPLDERTLEVFKQMMEDMSELARGKNKAKREKAKQARMLTQQNMAKQLKRAQRYLGLRPKRPDIPDPLQNSALSWEELQKAQSERNAALFVPAHDPELPCPWPFDASVVFIAVDIEAYERDNTKITEVGVSTLDVLDLEGIAPGINGDNWLSKIRNRHFRIREHSHLQNTEFVSGCASDFEFGKSEFVSLADAVQVVESCFQPPYSAPLDNNASQEMSKRNLIFLGHDAGNDVRYLQKLGFNPLNLANIVEILDTADMFRAWKRETNSRSLGTILLDFDIPGWHLHNAGNDARYTMQAMIAIAVKEASLRGKAMAKQHDQALLDRIAEAQKTAVEKIKDDNEGWRSAEEGDDGGAPVRVNRGPQTVVPQKRDEPPSPSINTSSTPNDHGGLHGHGHGGRRGWSDRGRGGHGHRGRGSGNNGEQSRGGFGRGRGGSNDYIDNGTSNPGYRGSFGRGRGPYPNPGSDHGHGQPYSITLRAGFGRGRGPYPNPGSDHGSAHSGSDTVRNVMGCDRGTCPPSAPPRGGLGRGRRN